MKYRNLTKQLTCGVVVAAASLMAPLPASADTVGFEFYLGNSNSSTLDSTRLTATRFTADRDMTINQLHTYLNGGTGMTKLALQADDGSGAPSGVDLASGSFASAAGWQQVGVASTNLVAGQVYHLVASNAADSSTVRVVLNSKADVYTYDGVQVDPNAAQMWTSNAGASWGEISLSGRAMHWGVSNSTTGDAMGQPYIGGAVKNFGAAAYRGQTFTFNGAADSEVNAMTVYVIRNNNATTAGDVRLHLVDATDPLNLIVLAGGTIINAGDLANGERDFFTLTFDEEDRPVLEAGKKYLIAAESTDSSATTAYNFLTSNAPSGSGHVFNLDYQGTGSYHATGAWGESGPTSLNNDDAATNRYDSYFSLDVTPIPEPATLGLLGLGALMMLKRRH